jgi:hypothetical protein
MLERTLYPGKIWPILGFVAFASLALLLASTGGRHPRGGAFGVFVLLIGVLFFAARLLPDAVYLKLTREGFEYKNVLRAKFVKWSDVDHFTTYSHKLVRYVGWVYRDTASVNVFTPFWPWSLLPRPINRFMTLGVDDGFTVNFHLKNAEGLASLLEQWRKECDDTTWVNIGSAHR